ncbi:hypothetical protein WEN_02375 [Mycoplasma wenyonii str. Massachusetts]|uniref:Uncharacterized protein n=1 Tax=Mycoplasma wenyonii (strain Massachusetts) TaxID=1197325 RepID=I6ZF94_MYCWM|nr:hypothetical protein [Mycoplasma wenyonii]AFN65262.1 hypothetical protein WEN_02375 [Mycoplasma wenyonii str. Massachusetts]
MSFLVTSIAKVALATLGGVSIIAPTAYVLSGGRGKSAETKVEEKYKFDRIEDFDNCLVVMEGNSPTDNYGEEDDGRSNRRVLACSRSSSTETKASFYLWKKPKGGSQELPKEISLAQIQDKGISIQLILTFSTSGSDDTEIVNLYQREWVEVLNEKMNLKEKCSVSFESKQVTFGKRTKRSLLLKEMNQSSD